MNIKDKVLDALKSGALEQKLTDWHMHNLVVHKVSENPYSGMCRWAITGTQYERLSRVYEELGFGELKSHMRNFRYSERYDEYRFSTGGGYAVFDADLLGGDGSREVQDAFQEAGMRVE